VIDAATTSGVTSTGLQQLTQQTTPVALAPTAIQSNSFVAKWKKMTGATSYTLFLYRKNYNQTTDSLINQFSVTDTAYVVSNLSPNQKYSYRVSIQPSLCNDEAMPLSNMMYVTTITDLVTIEPIGLLNINIYPTFCHSELFLTECDSAYFTIFDLLGKIQLSSIYTAAPILVESLKSGIYYIKIDIDNESVVRKFIKN